MALQRQQHQLTHIRAITTQLAVAIFGLSIMTAVSEVKAGVFYPRGGSFGYLAAVAIPVDLPNRDIYMAFNFESNYGLPSNDSYNEWIDRWDLDENFLGIGNNVTAINGRRLKQKRSAAPNAKAESTLLPRYDRNSFYRTFTGYLDYYQMNGTGCLLRTICEVAASSMEENNGVLGSILKILFMPTTSRPEMRLHNQMNDEDLFEAEWQGRQYLANLDNTKDGNNNVLADDEGDGEANEEDSAKACLDYTHWCPEGVISLISDWY